MYVGKTEIRLRGLRVEYHNQTVRNIKTKAFSYILNLFVQIIIRKKKQKQKINKKQNKYNFYYIKME